MDVWVTAGTMRDEQLVGQHRIGQVAMKIESVDDGRQSSFIRREGTHEGWIEDVRRKTARDEMRHRNDDVPQVSADEDYLYPIRLQDLVNFQRVWQVHDAHLASGQKTCMSSCQHVLSGLRHPGYPQDNLHKKICTAFRHRSNDDFR